MTPAIQHRPESHRFEAAVDGAVALVQYRLHDGGMEIVHTEVPPALEGHGLASALVAAAAEHARREGLRVRATCSYAAGWMDRHSETASMRA